MTRRRTLLILGVPLVLILGLGSVFVWGQMQPRPPGYAPTDPNARVVEPQVAPAVVAEPVTEDVVAAAAGVAPTQYTVDARDKEEWAFFDLDEGRVVPSTFESLDWDLAFRRTRLLTNSGATNPKGSAGATDLGEASLESARPPASPRFTVDELDGDDGDELRNAAISRWYRYNFIRHVVVARPNVYLVRTGERRTALVQFASYYCDDGTPGCVTFTYRLFSGGDDASAARK
jgi:hypothetical protein